MSAGAATVLLFAAALATSPDARPAAPARLLDLSGLEAFWRLRDALARGEELNDARWAALTSAGGYSSLGPAAVAQLRAPLRLAFSPAAKGERDVALSRGGRTAELVRHLQQVDADRAALTAFCAGLDGVRLVESARGRALAFLPSAASRTTVAPPVNIAVFWMDAFARGGAITIDLALAAGLGRDRLVDLVAHELHHLYLYPLWRRPDPPPGDPRRPLHDLFTQVHIEGLADFVDKRAVPLVPGPGLRASEYNDAYAAAPKTVAALDDLLCRLGRAELSAVDAAVLANGHVVLSGHPLGFFMANVIRARLGHAALVATAGDPYEFFLEYARAARRGAERDAVLSSCALAAVRRFAAEIPRVAPASPPVRRARR